MVTLFGRKSMSQPRHGEQAGAEPADETPNFPQGETGASDSPILSPRWAEAVAGLSHAFQPVVNIHSGHTYGIEALLRGFERFGFDSAEAVFDAAFAA